MGKRRRSSSSSSTVEKKARRKVKLSKHEKLVEKLEEMKREGKGAAPNGVVLTKDDYYTRQAEFAVWLGSKKKKLDDFDSTQRALEFFCKFALAWNTNTLPSKYYTGLTATSLDSSCRTRYKWSFVDKLDAQTKMEVGTARDSTDTNTFAKNWTTIHKKDSHGSKPAGTADGCSSCRGPWPCRNPECPKGRPATDRPPRDASTCGACNGPWPCRNGNCPRGRPVKGSRSTMDLPAGKPAEAERYSKEEVDGFDHENSLRRAMGQERVSMFDD